MINNNPGGRLWVDPDGVEGLGRAYEGHVQLYDTYLAQLSDLRTRYADAWGDDDMGKQFSTKFLEGLGNLESIIGGVKGTLAYTSEGLTQSASAYRQADEDATEAGHTMLKEFEKLENTPSAFLSDADDTPLQPTRRTGFARVAVTEPGHGEPLVMRASTEEEARQNAIERPREEVFKNDFVPREQTQAYMTAPLQPAISSMFMKPEYATAHIGGRPLPPGYQLISLNTFEDGSARVDANLYNSITPVTGATVTTPEGTTIDPGRGQLFVVKDNPGVDPTAPDYVPLVLSYAPDGTPTPILPGF